LPGRALIGRLLSIGRVAGVGAFEASWGRFGGFSKQFLAVHSLPQAGRNFSMLAALSARHTRPERHVCMESAVITPHRRIAARARVRALTTVLVVLGTALPLSQASAQGIFDFFFGGFRRQQSPSVSSYADPNSPFGPRQESHSDGGVAFCVRT